MAARWLFVAMIGLGSVPAIGGVLSAALGEFSRKSVLPYPMVERDKALFAEYGLLESERAVYVSAKGKEMLVDGLRFVDSRSGHAAFLWLRPPNGAMSGLGVSTTWGGVFAELRAVVGGGITYVEWQNYVFAFHGAAPDRDGVDSLISGLTKVDPNPVETAYCCRYVVTSSDRLILGPVSLERFARGIPPSIVAFRLGGIGRVTDFETPAGRMKRVMFEYPTAAVARDRLAAFEALRIGIVRVGSRRMAIILDPADREEAEKLLNDVIEDRGNGPEGEPVSFDPAEMGVMDLEGGLWMMVIAAGLGAAVGILRCVAGKSKKGVDPRLSIRPF